MKIALGSDHRGDTAATTLAAMLTSAGHDVTILGGCGAERRDYTDAAWLVGREVAQGAADRGILICGSGIGMGMAANKVDGVRAVVAADTFDAQMSRRHNNANVLCLAGDLRSMDEIDAIVTTWMDTDFEGGRHARRVEKLACIERGDDPAALPTTATTGS